MSAKRSFATGALAAVMSLGSLLVAPSAEAQTGTHQRYGELRSYFDDWLAACRPGGFCSAIAYSGTGPGSAGVDADYLLRVAQPTAGARYQIVFTGVASFLGENSGLEFVVDGRSIASVPAGGPMAWYTEQSVNEYFVPTPPSHDVILPDLLAGRFLELRFTDADGSARSVVFSLRGLTAALRWFDDARQP